MPRYPSSGAAVLNLCGRQHLTQDGLTHSGRGLRGDPANWRARQDRHRGVRSSPTYAQPPIRGGRGGGCIARRPGVCADERHGEPDRRGGVDADSSQARRGATSATSATTAAASLATTGSSGAPLRATARSAHRHAAPGAPHDGDDKGAADQRSAACAAGAACVASADTRAGGLGAPRAAAPLPGSRRSARRSALRSSGLSRDGVTPASVRYHANPLSRGRGRPCPTIRAIASVGRRLGPPCARSRSD